MADNPLDDLLPPATPVAAPVTPGPSRRVCGFCGSAHAANGDILSVGERGAALLDAERRLGEASEVLADLRAELQAARDALTAATAPRPVTRDSFLGG